MDMWRVWICGESGYVESGCVESGICDMWNMLVKYAEVELLTFGVLLKPQQMAIIFTYFSPLI